MSRAGRFVHCVDSPKFKPDDLIENPERLKKANELLLKDDLYNASRVIFDLAEVDQYTYHAMVSVKLAQVQRIVELGDEKGLHDWYHNEDGTSKGHPSKADIDAYVSIFAPGTLTSSALKNFSTNAKKESLRAEVAENLLSKRFIHPSRETTLTIPKVKKSAPQNPYFDFWAWSCRALQWCGPSPSAERRTGSHHVLPIFMHHFGCATPSHESLEILRLLADGRTVADIGSGNGYWAYMLRRYGLMVNPVDNMQSEWRVNWVDDTVISDGVQWLKKHKNGKDMVLLLVYPVVGGSIGGGSEGGFTRDLVKAYQGDTIAVVGTQNHNGYTGFKKWTMSEYMANEHKDWTKVVQIPLPSFGGKDEALFVFQRGDRAPK